MAPTMDAVESLLAPLVTPPPAAICAPLPRLAVSGDAPEIIQHAITMANRPAPPLLLNGCVLVETAATNENKRRALGHMSARGC